MLQGFELPKSTGDITHRHKMGLVGRQERALLFGNELSVTSQSGKGTTVSVVVHAYPPGAPIINRVIFRLFPGALLFPPYGLDR